MSETLLRIDGLRVAVGSRSMPVFPVDGVTLRLDRGECLGLVGESGVGKTLTLRATIGMLPAGARICAGSVTLATGARGRGGGLGGALGMVFQQPLAALNPLMRVNQLIGEGLRTRGVRGRAARRAALALLEEVGIDDPELRLRSWPHELSGGQRQRVAIAMALASEPAVLLCDEPTAALDVTVQERILALLERLRRERQLAVLLVTHDLAVVARTARTLAVMYAGRIIEAGATKDLLSRPLHPYTARLLASLPRMDGEVQLPLGIPGQAPDPRSYPRGCRFHPRCEHMREQCLKAPYALEPAGAARHSACIRWRELQPALSAAAR